MEGENEMMGIAQMEIAKMGNRQENTNMERKKLGESKSISVQKIGEIGERKWTS